MDWLSKIFDVHKLPFKIILWIAAVSGVVLFAPDALTSRLHLNGLLVSYGHYVGVIFVASATLIAINATSWVIARIRSRIGYWKWRNRLEAILNDLDHAEKAVLREFYIQDKYTIELPLDNPTVVGLRNKRIVCIAGKHGQHTLAGLLIPFAIRDEVRELITLEMIDLPLGEPSQQDIERIRSSRPDFVMEIERRNARISW